MLNDDMTDVIDILNDKWKVSKNGKKVLHEGCTLSFCIPVYNNSKVCIKIVNEMLKCDSTSFQVVVSDDNSPDDTLEALSKIDDKRLKVIKHKNSGNPPDNWNYCMENADGEWIYLVMGRDIINNDKIENLLSIISTFNAHNITCARDASSFSENDFGVYKGCDALIKTMWFHHPTGSIFSKPIYLGIRDRDKIFLETDVYPELIIFKEHILQGDMLIFDSSANSGIRSIIFSETQSQYENKKKNGQNMYYSPARRMKQCLQILDSVLLDSRVAISKEEKESFTFYKLKQLFLEVSISWREMNKNEKWTKHYGQLTRNVSKREMIQNIRTAEEEVLFHYADIPEILNLVLRFKDKYERRAIVKIILPSRLIKVYESVKQSIKL